MSFIRASGLGPLTASNTATIVDPATPAGGVATMGPLVSFASQTSTSGTSVEFIGVPSWVKRVTVMLNGVSVSGTDSLLIQQGSGGSYTTSGYGSYGSYVGSTNSAGGYGSVTSGHNIGIGNGANLVYGHMILTLMGSNIWVSSYTVGTSVSGTYYSYIGGGSVTLSGAMDRVRVTPSGSNTFDAGSINVMYE